MLPITLRFSFRAHRDFFSQSRWIRLNSTHLSPDIQELCKKNSVRVQFSRSDRLRWAVVVPKKVGNAVVRNQNKRFIREAIIALSYENLQDFELPHSVVVFVSKPISNLSEAKMILEKYLFEIRNSKLSPEKK